MPGESTINTINSIDNTIINVLSSIRKRRDKMPAWLIIKGTTEENIAIGRLLFIICFNIKIVSSYDLNKKNDTDMLVEDETQLTVLYRSPTRKV